jgi:hypothetical protein
MRYLKTNTQTMLTVGPLVNSSNGFDVVTTLNTDTVAVTMYSDDNGTPNVTQRIGAVTGTTVSMSHLASGLWRITLTASHTNFQGRAVLQVHGTGICPAFHDLMVVNANVYDSLFADGSVKLQSNVVQIMGVAANPTPIDVATINGVNANLAIENAVADELLDWVILLGEAETAAIGGASAAATVGRPEFVSLLKGGDLSIQSTVAANPTPTQNMFALNPVTPAISTDNSAYINCIAVPLNGSFRNIPRRVTAFSGGNRQVTVETGWGSNGLASGTSVVLIGRATA